ncbi:hypothetical protein ACFSPU_02210 [Haoranjiania flava]|uniref:Lipoprotein n=1 Tax=Haoranjiania flava TaxID=1856322 RepID=A0AAE3LJ43_9BACT|nr:hypothetical protein [Haoranjiania flava]MCU7693044.1 hypothetical protein [Haoranjiania flava]
MKTILLCSLALLLSAGSCKKSAENQLPPATQTGANTFGCLINGKPLIANRKPPKGMSGLSNGTTSYSINLSYPGLSIYGISYKDNVHPDNVRIRIPQFKGIGNIREKIFYFGRENLLRTPTLILIFLNMKMEFCQVLFKQV